MAPTAPLPLWKRFAWFVAIWALSIVALGLVATVLRFWLKT
ncbi:MULTISPECIES: DUF2474 family protein [unclassified Methylobacterium]|jgi:hypothetical protein|nr:DUF2474 family protein [Methylobacterium sp. 2A]MWV20612.1 DUF2474 family protein [Methylobacterium sp. 2A]